MTSLPVVSIVIPTFNRAKYLRRGLMAIRKVEYPSLEVIVVDGGSNDGTQALLTEFSDTISICISEPDSGEYDAINKGVRAASGEIIKLLTDDDVIHPGSIQCGVDYLLEHPDVEILFGQCAVWDSSSATPMMERITNYVDPSALAPNEYFVTTPGPPSLGSFIRKSVFDKIGLFSTDFVIGDYEFWARAVVNGIRFGLIDEIVVDYHFTGENTVTRRESAIRKDMVRIAEKYGSQEAVAFAKKKQRQGDRHDMLKRMAHSVGFHPYRWMDRIRSRTPKPSGV